MQPYEFNNVSLLLHNYTHHYLGGQEGIQALFQYVGQSAGCTPRLNPSAGLNHTLILALDPAANPSPGFEHNLLLLRASPCRYPYSAARFSHRYR